MRLEEYEKKGDRPWLTFYGKNVPAHIRYPEVPLYFFLDDARARFPHRPATLFFRKTLTYEELFDRVEALATAFQKTLKIQKGDRVLLVLPNCPQFVMAFYAILKAGGIAVQGNPLYTQDELRYEAKDSGARYAITLDILYPKLAPLLEEGLLEGIVVARLQSEMGFPYNLLFPLKLRKEGRAVRVPQHPRIFSFEKLLETEPDWRAPNINPREDVALFQYTGGTTGTPKAVMLSHFNLVANTYQIIAWSEDVRYGEETLLAVIPFFHVYGMSVALNFAIATATRLVIHPQFHVKNVLRDLERYRVSYFPGVPSMYIALLNHPDVRKYDLSSIRVCLSGAAPLPVKVKEEFERLTGAKLLEGYGLSEASPVTHGNPVYGLNKPGSIGIPFPDTLAAVVDLETGEKVLPPGEAGELVVKGPQVMLGYWNRPEETQQTLRNGWLYTGDIARMDKDGYFYIVDRKKDMIIVGGYNVYPREVEEVLYQHPKVKEAAVVGIPHEFYGEVPKAFVVLKEGETATAEEIRAFLEEHLAKYKIPQEIEFRTELPKTFVGKVLRRKLREEETRG